MARVFNHSTREAGAGAGAGGPLLEDSQGDTEKLKKKETVTLKIDLYKELTLKTLP